MGNLSKIRLGAPTQFLVGAVDMGFTQGGVIIKYTPKEMQIKCDQVLAPVTVFRTEEEASVETSFYEMSMSKLLIAFGQVQGNGDVTTVVGTPYTDTYVFGGRVVYGVTTLDLTIPKNDVANTTTNWLVHMNRIYSAKDISLNAARDKATEFKTVFQALADPTQPAGKQLGYITEQY